MYTHPPIRQQADRTRRIITGYPYLAPISQLFIYVNGVRNIVLLRSIFIVKVMSDGSSIPFE